MTCRAEQRARARQAARALRDCSSVVDVATVAPETDPTDRWTLDVVLDAEGVPPAVLAVAAEHRLTVRDASPQGPFWAALCVL